MSNNRVSKIIRNGTSLAVVLPASLCRELKIIRGAIFTIEVADLNTLLLRRITVELAGDVGELRDNNLPIIKNG